MVVDAVPLLVEVMRMETQRPAPATWVLIALIR